MRMHLKQLAPALLLIAAICVAPGAYAFFPLGSFVGYEFVKVGWPLDYMDRNGDGDVSGANEGVPITIEGGDWGFSSTQQALIQSGFETWNEVSSSYLKFYFTDEVQSPDHVSNPNEPLTFNEADIANIDGFNYVGCVNRDQDILDDDVLCYTWMVYIIEDTVVEYNGQQVLVSGPAILDVDTAIVGAETQNSDEIGGSIRMPLRSLATRFAGLTLGLNTSPLHNTTSYYLVVDAEDEDTFYRIDAEERVVAQRNSAGEINMVGVTSTMTPELYLYEAGDDDIIRCTWEDLAPDDMAGMTFLYPREDQTNLFTFDHQAWYDTTVGYPSEPISGGYVRLWCDTDNDSSTARVPMYDTYTALYESMEQPIATGKFQLPCIYKLLETADAEAFNATYTVTLQKNTVKTLYMTDLDKYDDYSMSANDSTHGGEMNFSAATKAYPDQTFLEGGTNIYDVNTPDNGTPLTYDPYRSKIVSVDSDKTLAQLLPGTMPMFGNSTSEVVCPLNMVVGSLKSAQLPGSLRHFRDDVLLQSAAGSALVDLYYNWAPGAAAYLLRNESAMAVAGRAARCVEWSMEHRQAVTSAGCVALLAMLGSWMALRKRARTALFLALGAALLAVTPSAYAQTSTPMTLDRLVLRADDIVAGQVTSVECRWENKTQIVTDITVQLSERLKGDLNRDAEIHFTQLGGRMGSIVAESSALPGWKSGEEVLLFLKENDRFGFSLVAGRYGKCPVVVDSTTGAKSVSGRHLMRSGTPKSLKMTNTQVQAVQASETEGAQADAIALDTLKEKVQVIMQREAQKAEA